MTEILKFQYYLVYFSETKYLIMFFFLFLILSNFLIIPEVKERIKVKFALAIPTRAPITIVNEIIDTPSFVAETTIKNLSNQIYYVFT